MSSEFPNISFERRLSNGDEPRGVEILTVKGRVDSKGAEELDAQLDQIIDGEMFMPCDEQEAEVLGILINMNQTEYMGAAGLRVLVSALRKINRKGGDMAISLNRDNNENAQVNMVFYLAGADTLFKLFATEQEALQLFANQIVGGLATE